MPRAPIRDGFERLSPVVSALARSEGEEQVDGSRVVAFEIVQREAFDLDVKSDGAHRADHLVVPRAEGRQEVRPAVDPCPGGDPDAGAKHAGLANERTSTDQVRLAVRAPVFRV